MQRATDNSYSILAITSPDPTLSTHVENRISNWSVRCIFGVRFKPKRLPHRKCQDSMGKPQKQQLWQLSLSIQQFLLGRMSLAAGFWLEEIGLFKWSNCMPQALPKLVYPFEGYHPINYPIIKKSKWSSSGFPVTRVGACCADHNCPWISGESASARRANSWNPDFEFWQTQKMTSPKFGGIEISQVVRKLRGSNSKVFQRLPRQTPRCWRWFWKWPLPHQT